MTVSAKVEGLEKLRAKMRALVGPENEAVFLKANLKSAAELAATVRRVIPRGDPKDGSLVDSIEQKQISATGAEVSIGNARTPYPLHLEVGHRAKDGSHVPGKAFWYPARRVNKKKAHGRIVRAERAAIKAIMGPST